VDDGVKFFFFVIQYANLVPLAIYFVLDIIEIVHYRKSQMEFKSGPRRHFINTYNPIAFGNLGLIDYIIMDQSVLNLKNKLKIRNIYVDKRLYTIKQDDLITKVANAIDKNMSQEIEYASRPEVDVEKSIPEEPEAATMRLDEDGMLKINVMNSEAFVSLSLLNFEENKEEKKEDNAKPPEKIP
jgi:hypothetical protein